MFFNRNMGNVEYDNTLRLPPYIYSINTDVVCRRAAMAAASG